MRGLALAGLLVLTGLVYRPVLTVGTQFVYEDASTIQSNPMVLGLEPIPLHHPRWLTWTSYRLDAWMSGRATWFHGVNLALHGLVGVGVFVLATAWGAHWGAVAAAGVVLLHPIQVESVAYITGRSELLYALAVLGALACTPRDRAVPWSAWRLVGVGLCTVLAIGAKEMGLLTPLLVSVIRPLPRWCYLGAGLLGAAVLLWLVRQGSVLGAGGYPWAHALGLQAVAVVHGLRLLAWPTGLTVDADIARVGTIGQLGAVGLLGDVVLLGWRHRQTAVGLAVAWVVIALGPRLVAESWEWIAEHHWYVPLVGVTLLLATRR